MLKLIIKPFILIYRNEKLATAAYMSLYTRVSQGL